MTPAEAAWVRENVWTKAMLKQHRGAPRAASTCACHGGPTHWCQPDVGQHERCHRATPQHTWEALICDRTGIYPVRHAEPHEHPTPSITGPRRERVAQVWLADRTCRWICPCPCDHPEQAELAETPAPAPEPETVPRTSWTYELVELPLFDLATGGTR